MKIQQTERKSCSVTNLNTLTSMLASFSHHLNNMTFNVYHGELVLVYRQRVSISTCFAYDMHPSHMSYDAKRRKPVTTGLNSAKKFLFIEITHIFIKKNATFSENIKKPNLIQFLQILIRRRYQRFLPLRDAR